MDKLERILLVEDNENDIELTLDALSDFNLANKVDIARDGEEALDYFYRRGKFANRGNENPIVALLDIKMPKITGLEVLRQMKQDENLKTIPVVMLTSSKEESDLSESYKYGVNAYVVKPIDFKDFLEAVKQLGIFWAIINEPPPAQSKI